MGSSWERCSRTLLCPWSQLVLTPEPRTVEGRATRHQSGVTDSFPPREASTLYGEASSNSKPSWSSEATSATETRSASGAVSGNKLRLVELKTTHLSFVSRGVTPKFGRERQDQA